MKGARAWPHVGVPHLTCRLSTPHPHTGCQMERKQKQKDCKQILSPCLPGHILSSQLVPAQQVRSWLGCSRFSATTARCLWPSPLLSEVPGCVPASSSFPWVGKLCCPRGLTPHLVISSHCSPAHATAFQKVPPGRAQPPAPLGASHPSQQGRAKPVASSAAKLHPWIETQKAVCNKERTNKIKQVWPFTAGNSCGNCSTKGVVEMLR